MRRKAAQGRVADQGATGAARGVPGPGESPTYSLLHLVDDLSGWVVASGSLAAVFCNLKIGEIDSAPKNRRHFAKKFVLLRSKVLVDFLYNTQVFSAKKFFSERSMDVKRERVEGLCPEAFRHACPQIATRDAEIARLGCELEEQEPRLPTEVQTFACYTGTS